MFSIGKFYFNKKELFLLAAAVLLFLTIQLHYTISFFNPYDLLVLTLFTLLAKGFFTSTNDSPLLITFFFAIFLTLYVSLFQVIVFYFLSFIFLKTLKVI